MAECSVNYVEVRDKRIGRKLNPIIKAASEIVDKFLG